MNKVIMAGRLCKDIEVKNSASGTAFIQNSIAVDRKFKKEGEPTADFFYISIFGKLAEVAGKYLHKGSKVLIIGHIQNSSYTNNKGEKKESSTIFVDELEFLDSKEKSGSNDNGNANSNDFLNVPDSIIETLPFD